MSRFGGGMIQSGGGMSRFGGGMSRFGGGMSRFVGQTFQKKKCKSGKTRIGSGILRIFKFMYSNFVERIFAGSWPYPFFETKPMGITDKKYELNFAKNEVVRQKIQNVWISLIWKNHK